MQFNIARQTMPEVHQTTSISIALQAPPEACALYRVFHG